jgi:hypothetical protein
MTGRHVCMTGSSRREWSSRTYDPSFPQTKPGSMKGGGRRASRVRCTTKWSSFVTSTTLTRRTRRNVVSRTSRVFSATRGGRCSRSLGRSCRRGSFACSRSWQVVGSSPIIRSTKAPAQGAFFCAYGAVRAMLSGTVRGSRPRAHLSSRGIRWAARRPRIGHPSWRRPRTLSRSLPAVAAASGAPSSRPSTRRHC